MSRRICLVLDNPLRDLDGICLIAWHLVKHGYEVVIVPMNFQGFEIEALMPDIMIANYIRSNNINILKNYKNKGIKIAVLDTEGMGTWWDQHAINLSKYNINEFIDGYFCWGTEQAELLRRHKSIDNKKIFVTGSPRLDFVSMPWRSILPENKTTNDYVLINTNFPMINPKFTKNTKKELKNLEKLGVVSKEKALSIQNSFNNIFEKFIAVISDLASKLPDQIFILRPHPFESQTPYLGLIKDHNNIKIQNEGTSIQWINNCLLLLQLNCLTSLEAIMLGKETISFEWINDNSLKLYSVESGKVSREAKDINELVSLINIIKKNINLPKVPNQIDAFNKYISNNYRAIDGESSKIISNKIINIINNKEISKSDIFIGNRERIKSVIKMLIGFKNSFLFKKILSNNKKFNDRLAKFPTVETIQKLFERFNSLEKTKVVLEVKNVSKEDYFYKRGPGLSIIIRTVS